MAERRDFLGKDIDMVDSITREEAQAEVAAAVAQLVQFHKIDENFMLNEDGSFNVPLIARVCLDILEFLGMADSLEPTDPAFAVMVYIEPNKDYMDTALAYMASLEGFVPDGAFLGQFLKLTNRDHEEIVGVVTQKLIALIIERVDTTAPGR